MTVHLGLHAFCDRLSDQDSMLCRFDPSLEKVLRNRRRTGRHMPYMNVIPPGLDFSNLKVDLPEDPVIKEMQQHKPAYGGSTPKAPQDSPKSGGGRTPKSMSESSKQQLLPSQLVLLMMHSCKHAMLPVVDLRHCTHGTCT